MNLVQNVDSAESGQPESIKVEPDRVRKITAEQRVIPPPSMSAKVFYVFCVPRQNPIPMRLSLIPASLPRGVAEASPRGNTRNS